MRKKSPKTWHHETNEVDRKLLMWLERNAPWLMKLDSTKVMWRVGLELSHGSLTGRSIDESLLVAASILRQEYEDGGSQRNPGSGSTEPN